MAANRTAKVIADYAADVVAVRTTNEVACCVVVVLIVSVEGTMSTSIISKDAISQPLAKEA